MSPWRTAAFGRAVREHGVAVELIVPDHIIEIAVIDLIEGGADGIVQRGADAALALVQRIAAAAGDGELLTKSLLGLNGAAEDAGPRSAVRTAAGEGLLGVELEGEPPV